MLRGAGRVCTWYAAQSTPGFTASAVPDALWLPVSAPGCRRFASGSALTVACDQGLCAGPARELGRCSGPGACHAQMAILEVTMERVTLRDVLRARKVIRQYLPPT